MEFLDFINTLKFYNLTGVGDRGNSIFVYLNYKLEINLFISALIHLSIFAALLFLLVSKRDKINPKIFLASILILLIFINPRLKLYDIAFGIVFLNLAILYLDKKTIISFFVFNLFVILFIKEVTKYYDLNLGSPYMLAWYIFIFFFCIIFKKYQILNFDKN
tara:strand:- start:222 stop:707 length:486 start_codon:yes stop_codon:yes gene_type:complete